MTILRYKEITKMNEKERNEKVGELKFQLIKLKASHKTGKTKEIKRAIARIMTFNTSQTKGALKGK